MGNKEGLIDRICVARNENVGVYGFVFHRGMTFICESVLESLINENDLLLNCADVVYP